jgi:hypothetical protein
MTPRSKQVGKMINGEEYTQFRDSKILPSTTGFFISESRGFRSAGTGTFVRIGKVNGILTCAHALDEIARYETINLAIFPVRKRGRFIPLNVKAHCDYIKFGPSKTPDGEDDPDGPDLAFLRLPIPFFNSISHLVSVKSMEIGRDHAFADAEPSEESITVVTGMIAEWMPEVQFTAPFPVSGLVSVGEISDRMKSGEHDLFRFRPMPDEGFHAPSSYEGTSGGGLWRIYPQPADGGEVAYRLIGVAFYQTEDRQIICHGQASLYVRLFDAIREKWPEAN